MDSKKASSPAEPLIGGRGQRQVQLPFRRAVAIAMQSLRVRFWRSVITAAGVMLGIAFLSATFGQSIIAAHSPVSLDGMTRRAAELQAQEARMRQAWLVTMSLLVCTVGITNSMLMSVTERFKEIGTMKCLGALDTFIVKLFLIEAGFLGALSSLAGFALGFGGAVLAGLLTPEIGGAVWTRLPPNEVLFSCGGALLAGTGLTLLATIFPAMQAAKLPPAAALRSEI